MLLDSTKYLRICLEEFDKVSKARWVKPFNLKAIEEDVKHLQHERKLSYEKLSYFKDQSHWWFKQWWLLPEKNSVDQALKDTSFDFHQLSKKNELDVIRKLFNAFKSIELVSIILRFIQPASYGILSPPTERILDIRRGNDAVETYRNYLDNLRSIRGSRYQLERVADVDMALWVLHAKCFDESLKDPEIQSQFAKDPFMLRLRAENLFDSLSEVPLPLLAQAIQKKRGHLAALVGCHYFELGVRKFAIKRDVALVKEKGEDLDLFQVIEAIARKGKIDTIKKGEWHLLRKIRNDLIHGEKVPTDRQLEHLIKEALEIERLNEPSQA